MDDDFFRRVVWRITLVQWIVGIGAASGLYFLTKDWLPDLIHQFVCRFIVGPC